MRLAFACAALAAAAVLRPIAAGEEPRSCLHWNTGDWCDQAAEEPVSSLQVTATLDLNRGVRQSRKTEHWFQRPKPSQLASETKELFLSTLTARAAKLGRHVRRIAAEPRCPPVIAVVIVLSICFVTVTCLVIVNNEIKAPKPPPRPRPVKPMPVRVTHAGPTGYSFTTLVDPRSAASRQPPPQVHPAKLDPRLLRFPGQRDGDGLAGWLPNVSGATEWMPTPTDWLPDVSGERAFPSAGSLWTNSRPVVPCNPPTAEEQQLGSPATFQLPGSPGVLSTSNATSPLIGSAGSIILENGEVFRPGQRSCSCWFGGMFDWSGEEQDLQDDSIDISQMDQSAIDRWQSTVSDADLGVTEKNTKYVPRPLTRAKTGTVLKKLPQEVMDHFLVHNVLFNLGERSFMMNFNFLINKHAGNAEIEIANHKGIHVISCCVQRGPIIDQAFLTWQAALMAEQHLASCEPTRGAAGDCVYPLKIFGLFHKYWGTLAPKDPRNPSAWIARRHDETALILEGVPTDLKAIHVKSKIQINMTNVFGETVGVAVHATAKKNAQSRDKHNGPEDFLLKVSVNPAADLGLIFLSLAASLSMRIQV